jgi:hypothetical protein
MLHSAEPSQALKLIAIGPWPSMCGCRIGDTETLRAARRAFGHGVSGE